MNTAENNKLIAEFMELPSHTNDKGTLYTRLNEITGETEFLTVEDLNFERSWDWLMPVVEKINELGYEVLIGRISVQVNNLLQRKNPIIVRVCGDVSKTKELIYEVVIEFIKWYNGLYMVRSHCRHFQI